MLRGSTYVAVSDDELVVHALIGPVKRRFPVADWSDVELVASRQAAGVAARSRV